MEHGSDDPLPEVSYSDTRDFVAANTNSSFLNLSSTSQPQTVISSRTYWGRLASFTANKERPWTKPKPSPQALALAGFCFNPTETYSDRTSCFSCSISFKNWYKSNLHQSYSLTRTYESLTTTGNQIKSLGHYM